MSEQLGQAHSAARPDRRGLYQMYFGMALAILVIGIVTYVQIHSHIVASLSDKLLSIQNVQVAAIRHWVSNEQSNIQAWASEPYIKAAVLELTDVDSGLTPVDDMARQRILEALTGPLFSENALGYVISDRHGRIMAANDPSRVTEDLPPGAIELVRSAIAGHTVVTPPLAIGDLFFSGVAGVEKSAVVQATPVLDANGEPVAALLAAIRSDQFEALLTVGQFGASGETYAIDGDAWMVSQTRWLDQLKDMGLISDQDATSSAFRLQIRDPGGAMTAGFRLSGPVAALPLTMAAASAIAGQSGADLEGYRDYRGVRVMGTWRWLDDLGIGLITEIGHQEALQPLRPLIVGVAVLFGLFGLTAVGLAIYVRRARRLRIQIDAVSELGQYKILEKIGEGGMGRVYRAHHALLARQTAIKVLKPEIISEEAVRRFEREVRNTARLLHPNTIEIYDFGRTEEGMFYYAMEYLEGYDLADLMEITGPLPPARVVHILREVCYSLREAHGIGLIHRDIKPKNIMIVARGGVFDMIKVLDFGLVKDLGLEGQGLTSANVIPGTPPYIAPERMRPEASFDGRVDIYALGAVGFNLLTGKSVFDGKTALEIAHKALTDEPMKPSKGTKSEIPPALDDVILETLARDPAARLASVEDLIQRLDKIAESHPWLNVEAAAWWACHPLSARTDSDKAVDPRAESHSAVAVDLDRRPRAPSQ